MDSTHGISDPLSTSTTSASKFTAGSTFEAQLAKSTGLFTTDLFGHSGADAFKRILIKHARRTAGVDLDFDDLAKFGGQCTPVPETLAMLPPCLLPPAIQSLGYGVPVHLFRSPTSIAAFALVSGVSVTTFREQARVDSTTFSDSSSPSSPRGAAAEESGTYRRPYTSEEVAASKASTDKAFYLYGADTSLLDGDALLRGLLDAPAGEDPLASADRVHTLDPVLLHRLSTLLKLPYPDDWGKAEDLQVLDWRRSLITKTVFNLCTAAHYKLTPPVITAATRNAGPRLALSLRDAQSMVWRQGTVRELQLRLAVLHDSFPVLLTRMRSVTGLRLPEDFASLDYLPMELLTSFMDFLLVQDYIRALLIKAAAQPVALSCALKSQRAQQDLKCLDAPLCELWSSGQLDYHGSNFEKVFGLFPIGALSVRVALNAYVGSPSIVVDQFYELLRALTFTTINGSFSIGVAKLAISEALLKVDAPPLVMNVRTAYDLLISAVDRAGPSHPLLPQWAPYFVEQLTERNDTRELEPLPRAIFDKALARLEVLSKAESFINSLREGSPAPSVASLIGPVSVPRGDCGVAAITASEDIDYVGAVLGSRRSSPACDKCNRLLEFGSDYCSSCDEFTDGTLVCAGCSTPTSLRFVLLKVCRGITGYVPCNALGHVPPPPFRKPLPSDLANARVRHRRLCEIRDKRKPRDPLPSPTDDGPAFAPPPAHPSPVASGPAFAPPWSRPPPPAQPPWGAPPRPPAAVGRGGRHVPPPPPTRVWGQSHPVQSLQGSHTTLVLEVFVITGQTMPIISASKLQEAAAAAGCGLTATLGTNQDSSLCLQRHGLSAESETSYVPLSTRDSLYTFTGILDPYGSNNLVLGPGNSRLLYDSGAAMCVCGPEQLPLTDLVPSSQPLHGAGGSNLRTTHSGKLALTFAGGTPRAPIVSFVWPRGFRPTQYKDGAERFYCNNVSVGHAPGNFVAALQDGVQLSAPLSARRDSHHRPLRTARELHERFGVTDPLVFKSLHLTASGVTAIGKMNRERFLSLPYVLSAGRRAPVHSARVDDASTAAGTAASLDLTRSFVRNVDGFVLSAVFMDLHTWYMWESPMMNHTGAEFLRVLQKYIAFVRDHYHVDLQFVHSDCDPVYTVSRGGPPRNSAELQAFLDRLRTPLAFVHSPPHVQALNPIECAVRQLYHLMNFFLAQGSLSMLAWHDMLVAAVYARNRLPHPQSRRVELRARCPFELSTGKRPDLSDMIAAPGALVTVLREGAKSSACAAVADLAIYMCPDGAGHRARRLRDQVLVFSRNVSPLPPSCSIGRALAYSHTQHNGLLRDGSGLLGASASGVAAAARGLFDSARALGRPLDPNFALVMLNPTTGLPDRVQHAFFDGAIGLRLPGDPAPSPVPPAPVRENDPSIQLPDPCGAPDLAPALTEIVPVLPAPALLPSARSRVAASTRPPSSIAWLRSLPVATTISFAPDGKRGAGNKSAVRYARYSPARSLDEYLSLNPDRSFTWADLQNDLSKGLASLPVGLWEARFGASAVAQILSLTSTRPWQLAHAAPDALVSLPAFVGSVAAAIEDSLPDVLHDRARRLADTDPSLALARDLESLEDGSPSPPQHVGLVQQYSSLGQETYRNWVSCAGLSSDPTALTAIADPGVPIGYREVHTSSTFPDYCSGFFTAPPFTPLADLPPRPVVAAITDGMWRSVQALLRSPDWDGPNGWHEVAIKEIDQVIKVKKALIFSSHAQYVAARAAYPATFEILNLVVVATQKQRANGDFTRKKFRITIADVNRPGTKFVGETFSPTVDDTFVRFVANATLGRPRGTRRILDVKGAYFEGSTVPASAGGRNLWIPVPLGWDALGYPSHTGGLRNYFNAVGNAPGLRDAGRAFYLVYAAWLADNGFKQSIVERCLFYRHSPSGALAIICVYVDDNWTYFEDDSEWDAFYARWSLRFRESQNVLEAGDDFCGVSYDSRPDGTLHLSCCKLLQALADMIAPYPVAAPCASPMNSDMLVRMRQPKSATNPDFPDKISTARSILGLGMYVVRGARPDGLFAAVAIAPFIVVNLTADVWEALLHWATYLVRSHLRTLVLRPVPFSARLNFCASSDSSAINVPLADSASIGLTGFEALPVASMGGYALFFAGSGAFSVECFSPRTLGDSSQSAELTMSVWASKAIIAFRIALKELKLGPDGPTELQLDAKAVLDGAGMEKVARRQRYQAVRLAMLRQWIADGVLRLKKVNTADMPSDILSKPVAPVGQFLRLAGILLTGKAPSEA